MIDQNDFARRQVVRRKADGVFVGAVEWLAVGIDADVDIDHFLFRLGRATGHDDRRAVQIVVLQICPRADALC